MRHLVMVLGLVLTVTALGSVQQVRAEPADTASVVAAYKEAWVAGNLEAIVAQYSDAAVQLTGFGDVLRGKTAIRDFFDGFVQQNPGLRVSFSESAIVLNTAVQRTFFTSDSIKAAGVSRIVGIDTLVVSNGTIVSGTGQLDLSDPETAQFVAALVPH